MAANALVTPASRMEITMAGPAPTWPESPAIAVPMAAKMPAPMIAPMPSAVSCSGPRERRSPPPASPSAMHWSTVLRANSGFIAPSTAAGRRPAGSPLGRRPVGPRRFPRPGWSDEQRGQDERHRAQQLDEDVDRPPGGILTPVPDRVADDRRPVG